MNAIYCNNLSDFERQITFFEKVFDANFQEAMLALEMVNQRADINCLKAEARVIKESGTEEDLLYLYTEANNEASEQSGGFFTKIITGIKNFITNVWTNFTNLFKKQNKEDIKKRAGEKEIVLEYNPSAISNICGEFISNMSNGEKLKQYLTGAGILVGGTVSVAGIVAYVKKKSGKSTPVTPENVDQMTEENISVQSKLSGLADQLKKLADVASGTKVGEIFKMAASAVKGFVSCCAENIKKLGSLFKKDDKQPQVDPKHAEGMAERLKANKEKYSSLDRPVADGGRIINSSGDEIDPMDDLDSAMMESASLEELDALLDNL